MINTGTGFNADEVPLPGPESEAGRGILLMRELMDRVTFTQLPGGGTAVHLDKHLRCAPLSRVPQQRAWTAVPC
ncbi:hypothetical protein GCM10022402_09220 [Salinactinospora qingdaonensis]|uniref:Serine/threonine-protein kinase RsbW n=1 Tax=Salinactinospora qingdaonensis TaxID=702744 RepID=A0ABP7F6Q1_9ACTN